MPRHPQLSPMVSRMGGSPFSKLGERIRAMQGDVYPLHIGDTWMPPATGARMEDLSESRHPGMHRYAATQGHPELLAAIERRRSVPRERVLVSAGATGGLAAVAGATLEPGDEVLLLAPYWPLIPGVVNTARGLGVDVPFYDRPGSVEERLEPYLSDRTVALYLNTPNNPTGRVLAAEDLDAIVGFARDHDLWLWSDEVYEDYAYAHPHVPVGPLAPERTCSVYSFSKAYGMAGNRCGYVIGPDGPVMRELRKVATHSFYSTPTASQLAAARVLEVGQGWLARAREAYLQAGQEAARALGVPPPDGGTFLFVDVAPLLDDTGLEGFLFRCLDRRLLVAPGTSCGRQYGTFIRICFTSAPPDRVEQGVAELADLLGRRG